MASATVVGVGTALLVCVATLVFWLKRRGTKSEEEIEAELTKKFAVRDGITFYDNALSPCASRVRITLREKGIKHNVVQVDLESRENRHPSYLAINPLGKCRQWSCITLKIPRIVVSSSRMP